MARKNNTTNEAKTKTAAKKVAAAAPEVKKADTPPDSAPEVKKADTPPDSAPEVKKADTPPDAAPEGGQPPAEVKKDETPPTTTAPAETVPDMPTGATPPTVDAQDAGAKADETPPALPDKPTEPAGVQTGPPTPDADESQSKSPKVKPEAPKEPEDPNIAKVLAWAQRAGASADDTERLLASVPKLVKTGLVWQNDDGTRDYTEGATDAAAIERAAQFRKPGQRFLWNALLNGQ